MGDKIVGERGLPYLQYELTFTGGEIISSSMSP